MAGPSTIFEIVGDPTRRRIMELVRDRERPVGELVVELQLDEATVAGHLRVLREAAVVSVRQQGRQRWYGLRAAPLAELDAWLHRLRTD